MELDQSPPRLEQLDLVDPATVVLLKFHLQHLARVFSLQPLQERLKRQHLALMAVLSLLRRQNQALPMLTGRVRGSGPDLVRHNRTWLAALMLLAVVALGAWQWCQAVPST